MDTHDTRSKGKKQKGNIEEPGEKQEQVITETSEEKSTGQASGDQGGMNLQAFLEQLQEKMEENLKKMEETSIENQRKMEQTMEENQKKMEETSRGNREVLKKMEETSRENQRKMEQTMEENQKKMEETSRGNREVLKKMEESIEKLRGELGQEYKNIEERIDGKIETISKECKEAIEREEETRDLLVAAVREEFLGKTNGISANLRQTQGDVTKNQEDIIGIRNQTNSVTQECEARWERKLKEREEYLEKKIEMEKRKATGGCRGGFITNLDLGNKFNGNYKSIHPVTFIASLKNKVRHLDSLEDIKDVIRNNITGIATIWFASVELELQNFQQFEEVFLQNYWNEPVQAQYREILYFGKFNYNRSADLVSYALRLYSTAQHLTPKIKESEIALSIGRHFRPEVLQTLVLQNINTVQGLIQFLSRIQRGNEVMPGGPNYGRDRNSNRNNFNRNFDREPMNYSRTQDRPNYERYNTRFNDYRRFNRYDNRNQFYNSGDRYRNQDQNARVYNTGYGYNNANRFNTRTDNNPRDAPVGNNNREGQTRRVNTVITRDHDDENVRRRSRSQEPPDNWRQENDTYRRSRSQEVSDRGGGMFESSYLQRDDHISNSNNISNNDRH